MLAYRMYFGLLILDDTSDHEIRVKNVRINVLQFDPFPVLWGVSQNV
jgi:hypothetical protein